MRCAKRWCDSAVVDASVNSLDAAAPQTGDDFAGSSKWRMTSGEFTRPARDRLYSEGVIESFLSLVDVDVGLPGAFGVGSALPLDKVLEAGLVAAPPVAVHCY